MRHAIVLAALLAALFACSAALAQTKVVVAYGLAADFLPAFVAKEEGIFAKHKLDVTLNHIQNASLVPAALAAGNAHIGINTAPNLLLSSEGGLDQVAVAGAARLQKGNPRIALVTRSGTVFQKADDLRGRRIGIPGLNSVIDLFLRKWLLDRNVPVSQVSIVEVPAPQMGDLLKSGQVDAVAVFEPIVSRIVASGVGTRSIDFFSEVNPDVLGSFWAAPRSWASANTSAVTAFRASLAEAQQFIAQNPERARAIEAKYLGNAGPRFPTFKLGVSPGDFEYFIRVGRELGLVKQSIDTTRLIAR